MAQPGAKQIETALLTEHLRFTPLTLLDDIINTINILMNRAVDAAEQGLLDAPISALGYRLSPSSTPQESEEELESRAKREIEEGIVKLETLLESNVDKNFDKLEIYVLRNILCVEQDLVPWVRLGHYEGLDFSRGNGGASEQQSNGKKAPTQEGIQSLRRSLRESRRLHSAMNAQIAENSKLIAQLKALTAPAGSTSMGVNGSAATTHTSNGALSFLASDELAQKLGVGSATQQQQVSTTKVESADGDAMDTTASSPQQPPTGPLETNTLFTISQLPALRALVADLRSKTNTSQTDKSAATSGLPHRRDKDFERRLYIEAQSRKAVERIQGVSALDATAGARARDVLSGRRVNTEEVVALEGITRGLQAGRGGGGGEEMDES